MRTSVFTFLLLAISSASFCQKHLYWYDSVISHYNYLNNTAFPELELEDTSGKLIQTASLVGKTVYIDFWFTTCPPCVKEIPYSKALQEYFSRDSNIVFLSICIESIDKKASWKQMIKENALPGLQLFYARNRPQKVNLLRKYNIAFPTYLILNTQMKVIGYDAPRPSQKGWVHWAIMKAQEGKNLSVSYKDVITGSPEYRTFIKENSSAFGINAIK